MLRKLFIRVIFCCVIVLRAQAFLSAQGFSVGACPWHVAAKRRYSEVQSMKAGELPIKNVAVIGAGAAGLAAARELRKEFNVKVLEQAHDIGGVWLYTDEVEEDASQVQASPDAKPRRSVHTSLYRSLRTNLPREVMQYSDFPFSASFSDLRYPHHSAVLEYIKAYAQHNDLRRLITFGRKVIKVEPTAVNDAGRPTGWSVHHCSSSSPTSPTASAADCRTDLFDAVVVCNGHYSVPFIPDIPGAAAFPGPALHSHSYREPSAYAGRRVLVIGASNSGEDLSREVSQVAHTVLLSARGFPDATAAGGGAGGHGPRRNIFRIPEVTRMAADGTVHWAGGGGGAAGGSAAVDAVLYCTGYRYAFPFIDDGCFFSVKDNAVIPLYKHIFPPAAPTLALLGLPSRIIPFPQFELQARLVAAAWAGRARLPPPAEMLREVAAEVDQKRARGVPDRYFHIQGGDQFEYNAELARVTGSPAPEGWRQAMYEQSGLNKRAHPDTYRDMPLPTIAEYEAMLAAAAAAGGGDGTGTGPAAVGTGDAAAEAAAAAQARAPPPPAARL